MAPRTYKKTEMLSSLVNKIKRALRVEQEANYQKNELLNSGKQSERRLGAATASLMWSGSRAERRKNGHVKRATVQKNLDTYCIDQGLGRLPSAITDTPRLKLIENRRPV